MDVAPARVDQIRKTQDGDWMVIPAEVGTVAADLKRLDKGLKVRFSKSGECWAVFHEHHDDCPHNGTVGPGGKYLVKSVQAYQSRSGIWTGLDSRVVTELQKVDPRGGYDFVAEVERQNEAALKRKRDELSERMGPLGEQAAHAARKDLGWKSRAFIAKKASEA